MGRTIAEKILSDHCGRDVRTGDIAICDVDFCFGQDGTSSLIIDRFNELGSSDIFDRDKFCMVIDHSSPSPSQAVSEVHQKIRAFAGDYSIRVYDVGCGISHQVIPENGHLVPGDLVMGADSHTCTYGAINALATGVGSTDLAVVVANGKNWFRVPETVKVIVEGRPPKGVYAKDIILHIVGDLGSGGCTYKSIEFCGRGIDELSVEARFTIANMAVETGAKCGIMLADKKVIRWVKSRSKRTPQPVAPDKDASYEDEKVYDISRLEPQVARPHAVDNTCSVGEVEGTHIDEAFLGTCTNGRLEDLEVACHILKGRKVAPWVKFIVAPASREIMISAIKKGMIEVFIEAGCAVANPGCGPCVGTHSGVPADGEVVISSANRNFKGRMGNPNASIYLASPATVAASAIAGKITDPRRYL